MEIFLWVVATYILTIFISDYTLHKYLDFFKGDEDLERVNYFVDVRKVSKILTFVPLFNLHVAFLQYREMREEHKRIKEIVNNPQLRDLVIRAYENDPENEGAKALYNEFYRKRSIFNLFKRKKKTNDKK